MVNFIIPFIDDALGRSVIYEEYKGDFALAWQIAEKNLNYARSGNNPILLADALLARGIVHMLQGEPRSAMACFTGIEHIEANPGQVFRAHAYSMLATHLNFNFFPNSSGANALEIQTRWDGQSWAEKQDQRWTELSKHITDPDIQLEIQLVGNLLTSVFPARSWLGGQSYQKDETGSKLLDIALMSPKNFQQKTVSMGVSAGLLAYTDMVSADLCWRARQYELAQQHLAQAYTAYSQIGDLAGAAVCRMIQGDWLAAPYSTPTVWNHSIQEGIESSELSWALEASEFDRSKINITDARIVYDEAERLFHDAGAKRGLAAIQLRYGYLAMLEGNYSGVVEHAAKAKHDFEEAGDKLGAYVASAHQALGLVGMGSVDTSAAGAIGNWGAGDGSFSFSLGLGLLFVREGRRWLVRDGDYERALECYQLAQMLFRKLGATSNVVQTLLDEGNVYRSIGERASCIVKYEQGLDTYLNDMEARPQLGDILRQRALMLGTDLYQLYNVEMDSDGIDHVAARLRKQLDQIAGSKNLLETVTSFTGSDLSKDSTSKVMLWAAALQAGSIVENASVMSPCYRGRNARNDGDAAKAQQYFDKALAAAHHGSTGMRDLLEAAVLGHMRRYSEAASAFRHYLNIGSWPDELASSMAKYGDWGKAEVRRQEERTHELAITFFTRVKAYAEAKVHLDELERMAGKEWWARSERPWESLTDCGELYEGLVRLQPALGYYDSAIKAIEERRGLLSRDALKTALSGGRSVQYLYFQAARTAVKCHIEADRTGDLDRARIYFGKAFEYAERGKARTLLDMMAGSATLAASSRTESQTMRQWRQINAQLTLWRGLLAHEWIKREPDKADPNRIADLSKRIESGEAELRQVETDLAASNPNFQRLIKIQAQVISLDDVSETLPQGTALLQYYFLGDDLLSWAITRDGVLKAHMVAIDTVTLEQQIRAIHSACEQKRTLNELDSKLAEMLLNPLAEAIRANSRLIVVPYGVAHTLPFHVLPWEGKPLVATHAISYLPGASTLKFLREGRIEDLPQNLIEYSVYYKKVSSVFYSAIFGKNGFPLNAS